jgi:hypothetical protein
MHSGMTRSREGSCEHDAHRKRLEYCIADASLQGSRAADWAVQDEKHRLGGAFRLDNADPLAVWQVRRVEVMSPGS